MEQTSVERVREDLETMKAAICKELPFGAADVRFYAALAVASGVFAVGFALGADRGWPSFLSGLPAILVFAVYLGYLAVKSRRHSPVNSTRRNEYRTALLILAPIAAAALAGSYWATRAGMSYLQSSGALFVVAGFAFTSIAMTGPYPRRYPRSYWLVCGLPMIAAGVCLPFCTPTQARTAMGCMVVAMLGLMAIVMHYHVCRQDAVTPSDSVTLSDSEECDVAD